MIRPASRFLVLALSMLFAALSVSAALVLAAYAVLAAAKGTP